MEPVESGVKRRREEQALQSGYHPERGGSSGGAKCGQGSVHVVA